MSAANVANGHDCMLRRFASAVWINANMNDARWTRPDMKRAIMQRFDELALNEIVVL